MPKNRRYRRKVNGTAYSHGKWLHAFLGHRLQKHCHSMHELSPADHVRAQTSREKQILLLARFPQPVQFVQATDSCRPHFSWSWICIAGLYSGSPERNPPWVPFQAISSLSKVVAHLTATNLVLWKNWQSTCNRQSMCNLQYAMEMGPYLKTKKKQKTKTENKTKHLNYTVMHKCRVSIVKCHLWSFVKLSNWETGGPVKVLFKSQ